MMLETLQRNPWGNDGKDNYFVYASPIWCPADERVTILFKGEQTLEKGFEILWIRNGTVKEFMDDIKTQFRDSQN